MSRRPLYVPLFWLLVLVLGIAGFWHTGEIHGGFRLFYMGLHTVPPSELVFYGWYALFSCVTIIGTAALLSLSPATERLIALSRHRSWIAFGCAAFVLVAALAFRQWVLQGQPVADDELTYRFVAQTLLTGHVTNTPPIDPAFLWNQFVVVGPDTWYGKYPIGHPLFLAVGEAVGLRVLVVPVITAGCVLLTHSIGRQLFDDRVAVLSCVLLALSPHFVLTGATELSQPTEMLLMLAGIWCSLRIEIDSRLRWAVAAGAAWGGAILVRPLPGGLFLVVAAAAFVTYFASEAQTDRSRLRARLVQLAVAGAVAAVLAGLVLVVNRLQTGAPLESGYTKLHGGHLVRWSRDLIASSVAGAALRQAFWFLGAPLALFAVAFARPHRGRVLFWGLIVAEYAYRVINPKTVVSTTGPVYVLEIVPLLALATADGLIRVTDHLSLFGLERAKRWAAGAMVGIAVATATMFLPAQIRNIESGVALRVIIDNTLDRVGVDGPSVVFANQVVPPGRVQTWAYYAENPDPKLSSERLYLRIPAGDDAEARMRKLWRERFPNRRAFVVDWGPNRPFMVELKE